MKNEAIPNLLNILKYINIVITARNTSHRPRIHLHLRRRRRPHQTPLSPPIVFQLGHYQHP